MSRPSCRGLRRLSAAAGALMLASGTFTAQDYAPATCTQRAPYAGLPLYAKRVDLPADTHAGSGAFPAVVAQRLDRAMDDAMRHTKAAHMTASVAASGAVWAATRSADRTAPRGRLYWASVGKVLTAVVVMQLVEEGTLALTEPVSRWAPQLPHGRFTTVDDLLQHTSGLFSANEDAAVRREPRYLLPEESIRISVRHGAMFCPGQAWRYSNTGYTVLGRIIEAVERSPYHQVVNRRIGDRLGLPNLRVLAPNELPNDVAPILPADGSRPQVSPSWPYAAGAVVGSAEDMVRLWQAVLGKRLLGQENTARLFERLYPMFDPGTYYGRGVMLYVLPDGNDGTRVWLGHSGGTPGAKAVVAYAEAEQAFVSVALSGDGSAEAAANLLLKQLSNPK